MIELTCPHCASSLKIEEQYAGQRGRCNKCGGAISVPALAEPVLACIDFDGPEHRSLGAVEGKLNKAAQVGKSMLACGCLMPFFLLGLFILIAILSPSKPRPFESEISAVINSIDTSGGSRSPARYRAVNLQGGVAVMSPFQGAYWVKNGVVYHANGFAKSYSFSCSSYSSEIISGGTS